METACPHCQASCEVPEEFLGCEVACPTCGTAFVTGKRNENAAVWYFRMPGGQVFGPISRIELDNYLFEGILTGDCQVLLEGDEEWKWAGEVFPEVPEHQSYASRNTGEKSTLRGGLATAGLLDRIPCIREKLPEAYAAAHWDMHRRLDAECGASDCGLRMLGSRSIGVVQGVEFGAQFQDNFGASLPPRRNVYTNSLMVAACAVGSIDVYLICPFSNLELLPHEIFAILPGTLPGSIGLRLGMDGKSLVWVGADRSLNDPIALAAKTTELKVGESIEWKWLSADKKSKIQLDWGMQMVPLGREQFVINSQSGGKRSGRRAFGMDAFFADLSKLSRFVLRNSMPGSCEARFPFHSEAGELLARMF
jgi:hypothetical protein